MKIKIGTPAGFTRLGKRDNNEDSVRPQENELSADNSVFVICDGMGGHEKGEVASKLVADTLYTSCRYLTPELTPERFHTVLDSVWDELDMYHNALVRVQMGTTMSFAALTGNGLLVANIGDSPIYIFRPGPVTDIVYRSVDHSEVYELLQKEHLTALQALTYTYRNVLKRAMMPKERYATDISLVTDLKAGDIIFMCSDGVLENLTDEMLRFIFAPYRNVTEIAALIERHCSLSGDNHTALFIPIEEVTADTDREDESESDYAESHKSYEDTMPDNHCESYDPDIITADTDWQDPEENCNDDNADTRPEGRAGEEREPRPIETHLKHYPCGTFKTDRLLEKTMRLAEIEN